MVTPTVPDARRPSRPPRPRSHGQPAKPAEARGDRLPCVVGGLLRGHPEAILLAKAAAGLARIQLVNDRFALVSTVLASRPSALVLPPFDANHTSTAPLVFRIRREVPAVAVLLLSSVPRGAGRPMIRAAQLGAHVIAAPTIAELRDALATLLEPRGVGH